jgi:competence protein ComEA
MFTDSSLFSSSTARESFFKKFSKKDWLLFGCMCSGLVFVVTGLAILLIKGDQVKASTDEQPAKAPDQLIYVDVSGAVTNPGIYTVQYDERVAAAIAAAGGLLELADTAYVAETLNLAKTLSDGEKIYIPYSQSQSDQAERDLPIDETKSNSVDSLISINNATESQLDQLPKVGAVTAQKIIKGRPYSKIDELIEKKIVSTSVWTEISNLIKI